MGLENVKNGKLLYHLTKLENLESILNNGLLSRKIVKDNNIGFKDVADSEIITKRTKLGLDKYTPFHFHPYSAFDVAVKNNYQEEFIYICITRELAEYNNFKILPMHPLTAEECILYDYKEGFSKIDWETMQRVGTVDDYSKHVKMAECLTELVIPAKHFQSICVKNDETKKKVEDMLIENGISEKPPFVNIQKWL